MDNKSKKPKAGRALFNGLDAAGHLARNNLERLGSLLDKVNAKSGKPSQFRAVDLSDYESNSKSVDNLFSQQALKSSQQLVGKRFATYGKYAKKVVPDSLFNKATEGAFTQLAKLAATWSEVDLPSEQRFAGIQGLSDQERNALARDIANQNRALATIGGVTGLAGLPGMLADTLWLLLVSLRTVYQLATVYDKPLTGKEGVKMAYKVVSHADLSKMQEKQTLLAGLGMAKGLLGNAQSQGLRNELKNSGMGNSNVQYYAEQVDKIAEQFNIDIDNMNLSWLTKLLPFSSVLIAAHYNSHLIEQVIGVARATFGPEPVTAKEAIADKSDSQSDNASSDDTDDSANSDDKASDDK
ncbi:EcsC family protein [Psychrobacter sp. FDAARGOS_221]|uniref:EcsC family protein n=1 Tax=Psychrobacter sp. FDAARGOS_221 TaxID=1975705 RepID=UPI000BB54ACD|nr:EcsC family protein [Psychrobacter sp. FDAARGOS_221]PNK60254.1 hypothetical protein A6J60_004810 [Psychrobacter sp. FDAARGOS_221]